MQGRTVIVDGHHLYFSSLLMQSINCLIKRFIKQNCKPVSLSCQSDHSGPSVSGAPLHSSEANTDNVMQQFVHMPPTTPSVS
ncbi:hypothetical protein BIFGAL_04241 [Bifidobacterium gallicum DSM 20093 = LMG 11596]|uniref:Uncharacterized protein n=1 Tax=Bifidobacterium gallicum DSM 20093 = LMG 11596 TaxID=561180 RepID=D1NWI7_9BIFI|nr:hypothetical protein BIFGAL_04241 [Bifidobacterium gallicum DSM 20093 = LMG 11596]